MVKVTKGYWDEVVNQRAFLEGFARKLSIKLTCSNKRRFAIGKSSFVGTSDFDTHFVYISNTSIHLLIGIWCPFLSFVKQVEVVC